MKSLQDKVAVITGAASGIGLAMAREFAGRGMRIVLADIERAALERAQAEVAALGVETLAVPLDVRLESEVNGLADAAYARFGAVHLLCNNAGVAGPLIRTRAWETSLADWQWIHDVNFRGVLHGVRAFVPRMLASDEEGHVVNTSSAAGLLTAADPYSVSKHAVSCLTEGLYKDLKQLGAKVSASMLCPGMIRTAIFEGERNRQPEYGPPVGELVLDPSRRRGYAKFMKFIENGIDPAQVAAQVAQAVLEDRFYVIPAQQAVIDSIHTRMHEILEGRNPTSVAIR